MDPDIIALQEHSEWDQIGNIVSSWFPSDTWNQGYTFRDLVILSTVSYTHLTLQTIYSV